nr:uncharacterized protein LOC106683759 isoform X2 [Halyomorpha halys]
MSVRYSDTKFSTGPNKMKKYIWLQELQPCNEEPGLAFLNGSFKYEGQGQYTIDLDGYAPRKIYRSYLFVEIKKCPTRWKSNDCEDIMSFPSDQDQCKNGYFQNFYDQFQPPISCPILGRYQAKNILFEPENYRSFFRTLSDEEWLHAHIDLYQDEKRETKKEACIMGVASFKMVRVEVKNNGNRTQRRRTNENKHKQEGIQ